MGGGYWLAYEMDGRDRWSFGLATMDSIMWQPRFGREAIGQIDFLGLVYTPLVRLDRKFMHPSMRISDKDFAERFSGLKVSQIHPHWRDEFLTRITATVTNDASMQTIQCVLRYTASDYPRIVSEVWTPKNWGASAPDGFAAKPFDDYQKYEKERYDRWVGKLALVKDKGVTLAIPVKGMLSGTEKVRFCYRRTDDASDDFKNYFAADLK